MSKLPEAKDTNWTVIRHSLVLASISFLLLGFVTMTLVTIAALAKNINSGNTTWAIIAACAAYFGMAEIFFCVIKIAARFWVALKGEIIERSK